MGSEHALSIDRAPASKARALPASDPTLPTQQIDTDQAVCDQVKLVLDGFTLDEMTLANSFMLPYLAMVAAVIEDRVIGVEELLHVLRRSMRQRSFDRLPRREYVLGFLNQHPP
jgi:hypothetical protein